MRQEKKMWQYNKHDIQPFFSMCVRLGSGGVGERGGGGGGGVVSAWKNIYPHKKWPHNARADTSTGEEEEEKEEEEEEEEDGSHQLFFSGTPCSSSSSLVAWNLDVQKER